MGGTVLALGGVLGACASLMGPRTVVIGREELRSRLAKPFPMTQRVLRMLDVTIEAPELDLLAERDRVAATFGIHAHDTVFGEDREGRLRLSFGLRYDPSDLTLRLRDVALDEITLEGLPASLTRALGAVGTELVAHRLQDEPVHRFKPEDLKRANDMGYEVADVRVTATGLAIDLKPKP